MSPVRQHLQKQNVAFRLSPIVHTYTSVAVRGKTNSTMAMIPYLPTTRIGDRHMRCDVVLYIAGRWGTAYARRNTIHPRTNGSAHNPIVS